MGVDGQEFFKAFSTTSLLFPLSTTVPPRANEKRRGVSPQNCMILNYITVGISTLSSLTVNNLRTGSFRVNIWEDDDG